MMMVRCSLAPSATGLGVFTQGPIRKGALIRLYDSRFDISYFRDDLDHVPTHFRDFLERYSHQHPTDPDRIVLDCDEGRFMAHSDHPNVDLTNPARGIAARDIAAGEELSCDHTQFVLSVILAQHMRRKVSLAFHAAE